MKTIFQNVIILSLIVCAFGGCKKKDTYKAYSFSSTSFSAYGDNVIFNASANGGTDPILDCGVIISNTSGATVDNALQKVSLGVISTTVVNTFLTTFKNLNLSSTYYAKGYIKDGRGYIYSNELSTTTHCMTVDSIYPKTYVSAGTNFVIYGNNFGTVDSNIVITLYNDQDTFYKSLTPTFINNNVLKVSIPVGFSSGDKVTFDVKRTDSGCAYDFPAVNIFEVPFQ